MYRLHGVTPDWTRVLRHRVRPVQNPLPPLRLRNGTVLNHGELDNPLSLLGEVFVNRWYDLDERPPPDSTMVDIGANIGAVSLFWTAASPSLRIHAYEPNPSARAGLRTNVEANGLQKRVAIFPEAVGRANGSLDLWVGVPSDLSTGYLDHSPAEGGERISVAMIGMEEVWRRLDHRSIWLLKIDTEGAEADILEGTPDLMLRATRNAIVEYHDNISPEASSRCLEVLRAAGFQCRERAHPWDEGVIYARRSD